MSRVEDAGFSPPDEEDFFDVLYDRSGGSSGSFRMEGGIGWRPATNVWETSDGLVIQADLAGLDRSAIEVWVDGRRLLMRGKRADPGRDARMQFHKLEIPSGPFERWIALPEKVDTLRCRARYEHGFLIVTIPFGDSANAERRSIAISD